MYPEQEMTSDNSMKNEINKKWMENIYTKQYNSEGKIVSLLGNKRISSVRFASIELKHGRIQNKSLKHYNQHSELWKVSYLAEIVKKVKK